MGWKNRAQQVQEAAQQAARDLEAENANSGGSTTSSEASQQTPAKWGWLSGGGSKLVEYAGDIAPEGIPEQRVAGGGMHLVLAEYAMKGVGVEETVQPTGQPLQQEF